MTTSYSPKKNVEYILMAFKHPTSLIDEMIRERSIWYGLVPFLIEKILYEFTYILNFSGEGAISLARNEPLLGAGYYLYKPYLVPFIEAADLFLFAAVIMGLAKLSKFRDFNIVRTLTFLMFLAIFGIFAFFADVIYGFVYPIEILLWIHPVIGVVAVIYLNEFVSRQVKVPRWRSLAAVLPAMIIYFAFRIPFFM